MAQQQVPKKSSRALQPSVPTIRPCVAKLELSDEGLFNNMRDTREEGESNFSLVLNSLHMDVDIEQDGGDSYLWFKRIRK